MHSRKSKLLKTGITTGLAIHDVTDTANGFKRLQHCPKPAAVVFVMRGYEVLSKAVCKLTVVDLALVTALMNCRKPARLQRPR
jgi:hypothetical protein